MQSLEGAFKATRHMTDAQRLQILVVVAAITISAFGLAMIGLEGWTRRQKRKQVKKQLNEDQFRRWEGHKRSPVSPVSTSRSPPHQDVFARRYHRLNPWLNKVGYFKRKFSRPGTTPISRATVIGQSGAWQTIVDELASLGHTISLPEELPPLLKDLEKTRSQASDGYRENTVHAIRALESRISALSAERHVFRRIRNWFRTRALRADIFPARGRLVLLFRPRSCNRPYSLASQLSRAVWRKR